MPEANTLTIGIFATIASMSGSSSQRTKDALKALKARGVQLGKPENLTVEARRKAVETIKLNAASNSKNLQAAELIKHLRKDGLTYREISHKLKWCCQTTTFESTTL